MFVSYWESYSYKYKTDAAEVKGYWRKHTLDWLIPVLGFFEEIDAFFDSRKLVVQPLEVVTPVR